MQSQIGSFSQLPVNRYQLGHGTDFCGKNDLVGPESLALSEFGAVKSRIDKRLSGDRFLQDNIYCGSFFQM